MDNPGSSLFQGPDIQINSQNNEEEEDLEDQKRRKEELQNLLTAALDEFNYDESTVNSSTNMSVASFDEVQENYKQASEPNEQLKVLYDVRLRELNKIKSEYDNYKREKIRENDALKNKLLLSEAEIRQFKISLKSTEDLLVEKTSDITELKNVLNNKDIQIRNYEKSIENLQTELCTYQSTINELQMKLQVDRIPFNFEAKRFNSEELQRAHSEQIVRLETLLDEQTRAAKLFEKEKRILQKELENLIEQRDQRDSDDNNTMKVLTKTLEDAQRQCKDLLDVVELLTKENQHLQERINEANASTNQEEDQHQVKSDDKMLMAHIEKLKKMLLDKSVQLETLNAKLKHYETDIKELLEYRQLKCDVYKKDFQLCENKDHIKSLLLMQNDLQNYRRTIDDKNQQILTLNSTNKDLQEKIEEMLLQTRNDIQSLSHKYSLPQLEQMTEELKNAEEKVKELQEKLNRSEERRLSLDQKLQTNEKNLEKDLKKYEIQIAHLKKIAEKERSDSENQIKRLQKDLEVSSAEIRSLKQFTEELINENAKLKLDIKEDQLKADNIKLETQQTHETVTIKSEYEELKEQLNQVMAHLQKNKTQKDSSAAINSLEQDMDEFLTSLNKSDIKCLFEQKMKQWKEDLDIIKTNAGVEADKTLKREHQDTLRKLQEAQHKIKVLEETVEDLSTTKTIAEGEKCTYQYQVRDCENKLEHASKAIKYLENELESVRKTLREKEELISQLKQNSMTNELEKFKEELACKASALKVCEEDKREIIELLQNTKCQLEEAKREVLRLQNEVTEVRDKAVRRNLEKELKEAENHLEQSRIEEGDVCETEHFKRCLQAEILKNELKLREDLQQEYLRKLKDIEIKYQKACATTNDLYKDQVEKMKNQETRYREHLAKILAECAQKIGELENDKHDLITQIEYLQVEYNDYKQHVFVNEERYKQLIKKIQLDAENNVEEWKKWSKKFVSNCLQIETTSKKSRDNILTGMKKVDSEIAVIEKAYKDKVKKCLKNDKY